MIDLRFYWALLMRRLPVMLALLIVCSAFGLVWAVKAPPTYSTSARLLVEAPQIADNQDNPTSAAETLQVIEQQLMTRANLIDVANKLDVFRGEAASLSTDEKVDEMRANTVIRRNAGRDQATLMTVGFTSTDPRIAAGVVNEFTTLILASSTRNRVGLAEDRLDFYQQEMQRLSDDLDQQNARILDFKRQNANALPENLRYNQERQSLLQERVSRLESDLATLQAQRQDMVQLFEKTGSLQQNQAPQTPEQQRLAALQGELNQVLGIYAEGSPRVKSLRTRIAAAERAVGAGGGSGDESGGSLLDINLSQIDSRMQAIDKELSQANRELDVLKTAIDATSANSIALGALERDQANIQARYNAAVANLGQARTSERIESSSRGQRITVIESANVPSQPSGPNRKKVATMGVGLGLGLAGGFFVLMELLNSTIRRPAELRSRFQITPLAVIPYIETRQERRHRRMVALGLILGVLILIPLGLWGIHTQYMPLDILAQKVVNRLGLG